MSEPTPAQPNPYAPPQEPLLPPQPVLGPASASGVPLFTSILSVPEGLEFATSWGVRLGAKMIDWLSFLVINFVSGAIIGVIMALLSPEWLQRLQAGGLGWLDQFVIGTLTLVVFFQVAESLSGTTLGKRLCGLAVVSESLKPISWLQGAKRNFALLLDSLFLGAIGLVAIAGSDTGQRHGDTWAKTWVVRRRSADAILARYPLSWLLALLLAALATALVQAVGLVVLV